MLSFRALLNYRISWIIANIIMLSILVFTGCGGSGSSNLKNETKVKDINIGNLFFEYSTPPILNRELNITIHADDPDTIIDKIGFVLLKKPQESTAELIFDKDKLSIVPDKAGDYEIEVFNLNNYNQKRKLRFSVSNDYDIDKSKIVVRNGVDINKSIGYIKNQLWLYSETLGKNELIEIVKKSKYNNFVKIMGYDEIQGLLVELLNDNNISIIKLLNEENGIDEIDFRAWIGPDVNMSSLIPNDKQKFCDGGDNWHLEFINAPEAWDTSTGSDNILIGVADADFANNTLQKGELKNKIYLRINVTKKLTKYQIDHGTASALVVGSIANNRTPITGLNWNSKLVLTHFFYSTLDSSGKILNKPENNILKYKKLKVITNSYTNVIDRNFNNTVENKINLRNEIYSYWNMCRKVIKKNPDKLFVWAAGNGIGNGKGNRKLFSFLSPDIYGVDADLSSGLMKYQRKFLYKNTFIPGVIEFKSFSYIDDPLKNLVIVAAVDQNKTLEYYSNYGKTVDIAAPTGFRANDAYGGLNPYTGTSAATPVVAGVASLIYSIYDGFTGEQVKNFLITGAKKFAYATHRYIDPKRVKKEKLEYKIPILNAKNAVEEARVYLEKNLFKPIVQIIDPFVPNCVVNFEGPLSNNLKDVNITVKVNDKSKSKATNNVRDWHVISNKVINGISLNAKGIVINLSTRHDKFKFFYDIALSNGESINYSKEYNTLCNVTLHIIDSKTKKPVIAEVTTFPWKNKILTDKVGKIEAIFIENSTQFILKNPESNILIKANGYVEKKIKISDLICENNIKNKTLTIELNKKSSLLPTAEENEEKNPQLPPLSPISNPTAEENEEKNPQLPPLSPISNPTAEENEEKNPQLPLTFETLKTTIDKIKNSKVSMIITILEQTTVYKHCDIKNLIIDDEQQIIRGDLVGCSVIGSSLPGVSNMNIGSNINIWTTGFSFGVDVLTNKLEFMSSIPLTRITGTSIEWEGGKLFKE